MLASRLELLDFENFKNLHPRRVDSNLNCRLSRLERYSNRFRPSQFFENKKSERRHKVVHFLGYSNSFDKIYNREPRSREACEANDSASGNSGPSGVVSAVGSLSPHGRKANVAAYGSGTGALCHRPGYQPRH
ncbi:hypothetical protein PIB30_029460 [Stylosanthes scabra]|uniref:Uncharacterized protein n=1 Tax=Stylosanthes scabra TaxID=79078 RepID=A0ABU6ZB40_9FABA|nr:hypothetical protein [Stylosanthes scabra]